MGQSHVFVAHRLIAAVERGSTLTPADQKADSASHNLQAVAPKLKKILKQLSEDPSNMVFIIAGRQRKQLVEVGAWWPILCKPAVTCCERPVVWRSA